MADWVRTGALLGLWWLALPSALASPLFESDEPLELTLKGPLGRVVADRQDRDYHPFDLVIDGKTIGIEVRLRGNSRITYCKFPPLRLKFDEPTTAGTVFSGQEGLKLVTHCQHSEKSAENNVLDEYTAYRLFNLLTPYSYRVRLARISYDDTGSDRRALARPYWGFLIESDDAMAERLGGQVVAAEAVRYPLLDGTQVARMFVFQYLIANLDYSLARAIDEEACCHNIDLIEEGGRVFVVPYDFDLSGLVNPTYAKPRWEHRQRRVTERKYVGYCSSDIDTVQAAVDYVASLREDILATVSSIPALSERYGESRLHFVEGFFEKAADRDKLMREFTRDCIGRDYGKPAD